LIFVFEPDLLVSVAMLWAVAVISPGPNFLVTARLAITRSRRDGLLAVIGIGIGAAGWGAAGCFGVQALFLAAPWMYLTLKLLGAAYLVFLGARLLWASRRASDDGIADLARVRTKGSAFYLGLATTIANPRSAISVASIFATTMPSHPSPTLSFAVIAMMTAVSVSWYSLVACLFTIAPLSAAYRRGRRWIDRMTGGFFLAFGVKLAAEP
jgi:threonine/homoserine/homoserine lactone efflux protein